MRCVLMVWGVLALVGLGTQALADDPFAEDEDPADALPLHERVNVAIERGVTYLREAQRDDGSWGPCVSSGTSYDGRSLVDARCYHIGPTAFSIFTLSRCGVSRKDETIKRGLRWLKKRVEGEYRYSSYESSAVTLMLCALYEQGKPMAEARRPQGAPRGSKFKPRDWTWMRERVAHLVGDDKREAGCQTPAGGWTYWSGENRADVSATQFALLALREAARAGYPRTAIREQSWRRARDYLLDIQMKAGGFPYEKPSEGWTLGMTAAGLSCLLIVDEQAGLDGADSSAKVTEATRKAFDHLGRHYTPLANVSANSEEPGIYHYCGLYAIERVGSLSRKQLLGTKPWYPPGAEMLVANQRNDGSWIDRTCMGPQDVLGTCFALLFLKRTTAPSAAITASD